MAFPHKTVYLAGPITGLSYDGARNGWRTLFANLVPEHIRCLSPMRAKDFLESEQMLRGDPGMYPHKVLATPKGILERDFNDVRTCDAVVANFLGAERASIGTCCEFGFAYALRKPVVMVIEPGQEGLIGSARGPNPHFHAFLTEIAGYVVPTLDEAAHIVTHLLTPGV